jgi:hypothetical protein
MRENVTEVSNERIILFNFASRQRPQRFVKALQNIADMCEGQYEMLIKLDSDDPYLSKYPEVVCNLGRSKSKVHAINRGIPKHGWDILINMSDDIVWTVKGFDNIIREHCGNDDFLFIPEPYADSQYVKGKNERIPVVSIMGNQYYNRDGYVYHPSYQRTHCDNEAVIVAEKRGRLRVLEQTLFYHEHPSAGYPVGDKLYGKERITWDQDKRNFEQRKLNGFA